MKRQILTGAITAGFVVACCGHAAAQDASASARLQKLEQAVTQLQAENQQLKAEIQSEAPSPMTGVPTGKFDISSSVTSIQLFGELLTVYRVNEGAAAGRDAGDTGQQDRLRYRLHLGTNMKVADGWTMGVVVETASIGRGRAGDPGSGRHQRRQLCQGKQQHDIGGHTDYDDRGYGRDRYRRENGQRHGDQVCHRRRDGQRRW